jgi:hypothetical protein
MKVNPYYSSNLSDPDVHHTHSDCPTGSQIPAANKRFGTNGYRRCRQCADKG